MPFGAIDCGRLTVFSWMVPILMGTRLLKEEDFRMLIYNFDRIGEGSTTGYTRGPYYIRRYRRCYL